MNLLFLTMSNMQGISSRGIYTDLMRKFRDEGHEVFIVAPRERRTGEPTALKAVDGIHLLHVKTLNLQKTNVVEKGIGQILVESQFKAALRKFLGKQSFDLILYSTPPITLNGVVHYLKEKNPQAVTYLILKDIFPQNAVDIGMFPQNSLIHSYFRKKEVSLYKQSEYIGCMSPANVSFLLQHNPYLDKARVEVAPNSIELVENASMTKNIRKQVRSKYHLPQDVPIFIYGGNLGKPQGIPFLIKCLEENKKRQNCHFVIVGSGTEQGKLKAWYQLSRPESVTVMDGLPKNDYDLLVQACDVGMIFLDHRFTIPNYPSRLLSYLEYKMPIIAATDPNSDIGSIAVSNGYGFWCESNDTNAFTNTIDKMLASDIKAMGEKGYSFLCKNYLVEHTYRAIVGHIV